MIDRHRARTTLKRFLAGEDGAVTVDWIVLTALVVLVGMGAAFYTGASVPALADAISGFMEDYDVSGDPSES